MTMGIHTNSKKDKELAKRVNDFFVDSWVDGTYQQLEGINRTKKAKETYFLHSSEEEVEKLMSAFEKKYSKKLKYRIMGGLSYFSYEETILSEKYED